MTVTLDHPIYTPDDPTVAHRLINSENWLTRDGGILTMVGVVGMTPEHQARVLNWLRNNAWTMRAHVHRSLRDDARLGRITPGERDRLIRELTARPAPEWIEDTPLVRRLVQLVPRQPGLPARAGRRFRRWLR